MKTKFFIPVKELAKLLNAGTRSKVPEDFEIDQVYGNSEKEGKEVVLVIDNPSFSFTHEEVNTEGKLFGLTNQK